MEVTDIENPLIFLWRELPPAVGSEDEVFEYRCLPGNIVGWGYSQSEAREDLWCALEEVWSKENAVMWLARHWAMSTEKDRQDAEQYGALVYWKQFINKLEQLVRGEMRAVEVHEGENVEGLQLEGAC